MPSFWEQKNAALMDVWMSPLCRHCTHKMGVGVQFICHTLLNWWWSCSHNLPFFAMLLQLWKSWGQPIQCATKCVRWTEQTWDDHAIVIWQTSFLTSMSSTLNWKKNLRTTQCHEIQNWHEECIWKWSQIKLICHANAEMLMLSASFPCNLAEEDNVVESLWTSSNCIFDIHVKCFVPALCPRSPTSECQQKGEWASVGQDVLVRTCLSVWPAWLPRKEPNHCDTPNAPPRMTRQTHCDLWMCKVVWVNADTVRWQTVMMKHDFILFTTNPFCAKCLPDLHLSLLQIWNHHGCCHS